MCCCRRRAARAHRTEAEFAPLLSSRANSGYKGVWLGAGRSWRAYSLRLREFIGCFRSAREAGIAVAKRTAEEDAALAAAAESPAAHGTFDWFADGAQVVVKGSRRGYYVTVTFADGRIVKGTRSALQRDTTLNHTLPSLQRVPPP
jgi:hypothetical protein